MDSIFFGFSTPKSSNPFSWLIRIVDKSKFSHAYIRIFDDYSQRWIIYQASGIVVNCIGVKQFNSIENICVEFEIPISIDKKIKTVQFAIDLLGTPYGIKTILGIGIVKLAHIFGKRIENPFADGNKSMVCSKLTACILDEIIIGSKVIDPEVATPTDVYNFLISKNYLLL
jgi:hypothetical protein